jgi:hypothetical protein
MGHDRGRRYDQLSGAVNTIRPDSEIHTNVCTSFGATMARMRRAQQLLVPLIISEIGDQAAVFRLK